MRSLAQDIIEAAPYKGDGRLEFYEAIGVSQPQVSAWKKGHNHARKSTAKKIRAKLANLNGPKMVTRFTSCKVSEATAGDILGTVELLMRNWKNTVDNDEGTLRCIRHVLLSK